MIRTITRRPRFWIGLAWVMTIALLSGCRSTPIGEVRSDTRVRRLAEDGREAFAEGDLETAIKKYHAAVLRAWSMDDPVESGNAAYNLAACRVTLGDFAMARDWLADARVELVRGGESVGNVFLLESRIATDEGRFDDAARYLDAAACGKPPCLDDDGACQCPTPDGCRSCPLAGVPCVGRKIKSRREEQDCRDGYNAQIHLGRAAWPRSSSTWRLHPLISSARAS